MSASFIRRTLQGTFCTFKNLPFFAASRKYSREPSLCDVCTIPKDKKPCFDIRNIVIERGNKSHATIIKSFLYTHFWPREPTIAGLWMDINTPYLQVLTEKYATSGDRLLAFERIERTGEEKLVGVAISNRIAPWVADELEEWAHYTRSRPEQHRMYFCAHCLRAPNLFKKYKVDYLYEVEVLATAAEVTGQGVGALLLKTALAHAVELRHPLVQVIAVSEYTSRICEKCGMKLDWSMNYADYVDDFGQRVFFPRSPHSKVSVYVKPFSQMEALGITCPPKTN